jgi:hypothetical protein
VTEPKNNTSPKKNGKKEGKKTIVHLKRAKKDSKQFHRYIKL